MFYDDEEDNDINQITFRFWENVDGVRREIETTMNNKESYTELVQQFVYFLQGIGYSYIGGISVLDNDGEEIYSTDI